MAIGTLPIGGVFAQAFLCQLTMTVLTVPVESDFEFLDFPLVFRRDVAFATPLNLLAFIPHVFTVFIDVMAFLAFHLIILGMAEM
jgi:hypothetical protein